MRILIVILVNFAIVQTSFASTKPQLVIVGEHWVNYSQDDGSGTYFDILRAVYGDEFQLEFETTLWSRAKQQLLDNKADILVGVYHVEQSHFFIPTQHLDTEYSAYVLFDKTKQSIKSLSDLSGLTVAGRNGYGLDKYIPNNARFFGLDHVHDLYKLINHGRIDAALVMSYNVYLADPKNSLTQVELIPPKKIYLAFLKNS